MRKQIRKLIKEQILKEVSETSDIDYAIDLLASLNISNVDNAIRSLEEFGLNKKETNVKLMWRFDNLYEVKLCFEDPDYAEYVYDSLEQKINDQKQNRNQSKYDPFTTMKNRNLSDEDSIYYSIPGVYRLRIIENWKSMGLKMIVFKTVVGD
jgi:hypothetical protein